MHCLWEDVKERLTKEQRIKHQNNIIYMGILSYMLSVIFA